MADQFRRQFLDGTISQVIVETSSPPWSGLAGGYLRYSCDHSNPRSLDQQLQLRLERARQNGHFIPWPYVFADAAVTGTTADRRGYELAKQALGLADLGALYIDEIGRASRDAVEALRLGRLVERQNKRLIGVSDSFDSTSPTAKLMLSVFATLQEWFIDQLRSKVKRGMDDAFARGTNIHTPSVGYQLVPATDAQGQPLFGNDGERLKMKVIDEPEAEQVRDAFQLYAHHCWSRSRIARLFNQRAVGGLTSWDGTSIGQLLRRHTYVGIEIYRRTYQVRDPETGKVTVKQRPRKDWKVRRLRHLQIVPWSLWKAAQQRLEACRAAYATRRRDGGPSRTEVYPKVLIRPRCGSCGAELWLGRSGKYASFCCLNGIHGKRDCRYKGYKSVRIVEQAILGKLCEAIITPAFLEQVLEAANRYLAEEAARPGDDLKPLETEIRSIQARRDRLVAILDQEGQADLDAVIAQIRRHERHLKQLRHQFDQAKARNQPVPPPMTLADVVAMLGDFRDLLNSDLATAAAMLQELIGPVVVEQVQEPGKTRPTWIAKFTINAVPMLTKLAASRNCPTSETWAYLKTRGWTLVKEVDVPLESKPRYQMIAAQVAELASQGASRGTTVRALGISWQTARDALEYARTGRLASPPRSGRRTDGRGRQPTYQRIADEVVRLRDQERMTYGRIAERLGVSARTAQRAYSWGHRATLFAPSSCQKPGEPEARLQSA